jgi:hypothetical protein
MFQRIWSGWLALLAATRGTLFRLCLVGLMLVSVFGSQSAAQFPNCNCSTLSNLCGGGNEESCWYYDWYCYPQDYCQCMAAFNDTGWCSQYEWRYCDSTGVNCPASASVAGGGTLTPGGTASLEATALAANGEPSTVDGWWSWSVDNSAVGNVNPDGRNATFTATGVGSATVSATFHSSAGNCGDEYGNASLSVTCASGSVSLEGPGEIAPWTEGIYSILGFPGYLPQDTSCSLSNSNAGWVGFDANTAACRFNSVTPGESTYVQVVVPPGGNCSASRFVSVSSYPPPASCSCNWPVNDDEWFNFLHPRWGSLTRDRVCKLGVRSYDYNCHAWAAGITNRVVFSEIDVSPPDGVITLQEAQAYFASIGRSNIAFYGPNDFDIQHSARKGDGTGPDCQASSKMGSDGIRIAHDLHQLENGQYGSIRGER